MGGDKPLRHIYVILLEFSFCEDKVKESYGRLYPIPIVGIQT